MERKLKREEFLVRIGGQSLGTHYVSIACDKMFFDIADMEELHDGNLDLQIEMQIQEKTVQLNFHFSGYVVATCDRCLNPVNVPMDFTEQLVVKLVENPSLFEEQEDDNLWFVGEKEPTLDVFHFVYESILLALPMKIVHPDDENGNSTCDPEVLKILQDISAKNDEIDPRWSALKNLKLNE
ncbi:MAG: DUF177 domain-containing protein [Bacteroidales bacterium]|nr:DUF177 domain-containing protein [Bacteroidales bacterium]